MARISNLNKAHAQIEGRAAAHQGPLTKAIYNFLLNEAVEDFNLDFSKATELSGMKFTLPAVEDEELIETVTKTEPSETITETNFTPSDKKTIKVPVSIIEDALHKINKLEKALSKIATLTGHGNYLREFDLEPWKPTRKDMNKNFG